VTLCTAFTVLLEDFFLLLFFRYRETLPVIKRDSEEDSGQFFEEIFEV